MASPLVERLAEALAPGNRAAVLRGDHDFAGDGAELPPTLVPAAVLLPVVLRPEPTLLFTTRTAHLRQHAGQVSFPGGRIDPTDDGPVAAALREAEEEIALAPSAVSVLGIADPYRTGTGYRIAPVVGTIPPDLPLIPNPNEVADLFEVPLSHLLSPANHRMRQAEWRGRMRRFYAIEWDGRTIWGATAGMLVNLAARLP